MYSEEIASYEPTQETEENFGSVMRFLETHQQPETGQTYYRCAICGNTSYHKISIKRHLIIKHAKPSVHQCQYCKKQFPNKFYLTNHLSEKKCLQNVKFDL